MKIAVVQMDAALSDVDERMAAIEQAVADAVAGKARLVLFPELCISGYGAGAAITAKAQPPEIALRGIRAIAERYDIAIVLGLCVAADVGPLNAAAVVQPKTAPVLYAKRMLYGDYEKHLFRPGDDASPIVVVDGIRCSLLICFDVEFPELVRDLARRGADLVLVPTALPQSPDGRFIAERMIPVRAFENHVFLAYANHCGQDASFAYQGCSRIVAPNGDVAAQAGTDERALLFAEIELDRYEESRRQNPYLDELASRPI